eukprot:gene22670-25132_t
MTTAVKTATATVTIALLVATVAADTNDLHAVGGKCSSDKSQQGWTFDSADNSIKFGSTGCLSEPPNWDTLDELVVVPCVPGSKKQNFTFNASTGLVEHGTAGCLALDTKVHDPNALRLAITTCGGRSNPSFTSPKELWAPATGGPLQTDDGAQCISASSTRPSSWPVELYDLWTGHDAFVPTGIYRIPSMVTTNNGTLLAFAQARAHSTDSTPSAL